MNNNDTDRIDEKLDEILTKLVDEHQYIDGDTSHMPSHALTQPKQAIKQFIASELNKRLYAHYADDRAGRLTK